MQLRLTTYLQCSGFCLELNHQILLELTELSSKIDISLKRLYLKRGNPTTAQMQFIFLQSPFSICFITKPISLKFKRFPTCCYPSFAWNLVKNIRTTLFFRTFVRCFKGWCRKSKACVCSLFTRSWVFVCMARNFPQWISATYWCDLRWK